MRLKLITLIVAGLFITLALVVNVVAGLFTSLSFTKVVKSIMQLIQNNQP